LKGLTSQHDEDSGANVIGLPVRHRTPEIQMARDMVGQGLKLVVVLEASEVERLE
jgi:ribosomal protein L5